jgi:hypothetical protein
MATYSIAPGVNPATTLGVVNPGDKVIVETGIHNAYLWELTRSGNATSNIEIYGQAGARIQTPNGSGGSQYGFSFSGADYWYLHDVIIEEAGKCIVSDDCQHFKIKNVETRNSKDESIKIRNSSQYFYLDQCTIHDTLASSGFGEGIYCGQANSNWPGGVPDATAYGRITDCNVYRVAGDCVDIKEGCHHIVVKDNTLDHSQGNAPAHGAQFGDAGGYSRASDLQYIDNTLIGIVGSAYEFDTVTVNGTTYGNGNIDVKGGSSTNQGDYGVVSQSPNCKVYTDFTSTGTRFSGSGSSQVNPGSFTELSWSSPASMYGEAAPAGPAGLTFVGAATPVATGGTTATHTVNNDIPGLQNGDILIAVQSEAAGANALSELNEGTSGFVLSGAGAGNATVGWLKCYIKIANNEPTQWVFNKSDSTGCLIVFALRNPDPTTPVNVVATYTVSGGTKTASHVAPDISPTVINTFLICAFAGNSGEGAATVSHSTPTNMTEVADKFFLGATAFNNLAVDYESRAATGATGTRTSTCTATTHYVTASMAIAPMPPARENLDEAIMACAGI